MITRDAAVWTVRYRCVYRDHWYDDSDWQDLGSAVQRAQQIQQEEPRRAVVILSPDWRVVWFRDRLA